MFFGLLSVSTLWVIALLVFSYVLVSLWLIYSRWRFRYQCLKKLPGVKFDDYLGALAEFPGPGEDGFTFVRNLVPCYPRIAHMFMGPFQLVVGVMHPESMKTILKTSEPKPLGVGGYFAALPWLGEGLLTSGGRKWARNRRLLTSAFHFDILKPYTVVNNNAAAVLVTQIESHSKSDSYFEVFSLISLCTLEVILKCAFSFKDDIQGQGDNHPYVKAVQTLSSQMVYRSLRPWLYPNLMFFMSPTGWEFKRCCNLVHSISTDVITRRKTTMKNEQKTQSKRMLDFLDILLTARDEDGKGLTDREIRDEVDTFLFEGHDTTASGISWVLYSVAENPVWQRKCQQEIDDILEGRESDEIRWDDLPKLKVLTACIKETLRLHPPVPFIERITTKDMYLDGYFVPKGTIVDIHLYAMMHSDMVWEDPMVFKPERFLDENNKEKDSYAFIPFSAGPRNCIGQHFAMHEMKVIICHVLRRFHLAVDPKRPAKHLFSVVLKTENGMYLEAKARS